MKKIQFNDASLRETIGTSSYRGYIKGSAREIAKVIGNPLQGEDKTTYEWWKKYGSVVFTVYDYKEDIKPTADTVTEYHIGTNSPEDTGIIVGLLISQGLNAYIERQ